MPLPCPDVQCPIQLASMVMFLAESRCSTRGEQDVEFHQRRAPKEFTNTATRSPGSASTSP